MRIVSKILHFACRYSDSAIFLGSQIILLYVRRSGSLEVLV